MQTQLYFISHSKIHCFIIHEKQIKFYVNTCIYSIKFSLWSNHFYFGLSLTIFSAKIPIRWCCDVYWTALLRACKLKFFFRYCSPSDEQSVFPLCRERLALAERDIFTAVAIVRHLHDSNDASSNSYL